MLDKSKKRLKSSAYNKNRLANFPSISSILEDERLLPLIKQWSFSFVSVEIKKLAAEFKDKSKSKSEVPSKDEFITKIQGIFKKFERDLIQPVINGTGVILHTNLGRAPLSRIAYEELADAVTGYSNLEFDLGEGKRSKRGLMAGRMLAALSGAEAGMAVNNNAAAVFLIVANIAASREVIISRGQLVQIGGGFRIPEIIERSGAILKELGTTNKTSINDYQKAINKNTALILIVHKSNFIQKGFTEEPEPSRIVEVARSKKIPVCYDLGSGFIDAGGQYGFLDEPTLNAAVHSHADLICFSGDKLLGGPQAGLIVGRQKLISALLKDQLYRAFRLDKLTIGLLEKTLLAQLTGTNNVPIWEMAKLPIDELKKRAEEIISTLNNPIVTAIAMKASFGGGSLPEYEFDSFGIKVAGDPLSLSRKLLNYDTPIVCRSIPTGILIDLRTVMPEYLSILADAIISCLS
jgi:L-seryl-tRNA(Ser) seleniumtransferase